MQIDRFLAIFWNIRYKQRVTTGKAITVCTISAVISVVVVITVTLLDSEYTTCVSEPGLYIGFIFTRTTLIFLDGVPKLVAVAVTLAVSIYGVIIEKILEKNVVQRNPVNLPLATMSKVSSELGHTKTRGVNDEPNLSDQVENHDHNIDLSLQVGTSQQNQNALIDEKDIDQSEVEGTSQGKVGLDEELTDLTSEVRTSQLKAIFVEELTDIISEVGISQRKPEIDEELTDSTAIAQTNESSAEIEEQTEFSAVVRTNQQGDIITEEQTLICFNTEFYEMVKSITTMNLITLFFLTSLLPSVILSMVFHNCEAEVDACNNYGYLLKYFVPVRVLGFMVQGLVVIKRLGH